MWALKTGRVTSVEVKRAVVYFTFAERFGFTPEVVDGMDKVMVEMFMDILTEKAKEQKVKR